MSVSVAQTSAAAGTDAGFPIVFGRELIGELANFAHRPYLVVTMADPSSVYDLGSQRSGRTGTSAR